MLAVGLTLPTTVGKELGLVVGVLLGLVLGTTLGKELKLGLRLACILGDSLGCVVGVAVGGAVVGEGVIAIVEMVNSRGVPGELFIYGMAVIISSFDGTAIMSAAWKPPKTPGPANE